MEINNFSMLITVFLLTTICTTIIYLLAYLSGTVKYTSLRNAKITELEKYFNINKEEAEYLYTKYEMWKNCHKQMIEEIVDQQIKKEKNNELF